VRTTLSGRTMLASLVVLATVGAAACTAHPGNAASPPKGRTTTPAATAEASQAAGSSATPTPPTGIQNLVLSSAEKSELTAAFVAHERITVADVRGGGPYPGGAYYAYDPATDTYWAAAGFYPTNPGSTFPGGSVAMFRKAGTGPWQVQTGFSSLCALGPEFFPRAVLMAWSMPTSATGCQD
jgi:hypothetical protein